MCGPPPSSKPGRQRSTVKAKNLADFPVEMGRLLRRTINQCEPFPTLIVEMGLRQQVRGLHHILDCITQVVERVRSLIIVSRESSFGSSSMMTLQLRAKGGPR